MNRYSIFAALLFGCLSAHGEVDFSGEWKPAYHEDASDRIPGPEVGDYMGLPINEAGRLRGDSYAANRLSIMQYQCRPHSSDYGMRGLGNISVKRQFDPLTRRLAAFETYMSAWGSSRTIWMDGRPHPPEYAEHTFQGFSTGVWNRNELTITTTHLKENYHRRNEVPSSAKRTVTEHWMRHGDILTVVTVVDDPVFFTEPSVHSQNWFLDPGQSLPQYYCEYVTEVPGAMDGDSVPHYLPGENPSLKEVAEWYGLPMEAVRGGANTLYPEYRKKMPAAETPAPQMCQRACNCSAFLNCL